MVAGAWFPFRRWKRVLWLAVGFAVFRHIKFIQCLNNGFRLFHENKIFGTIAEASAPSRGMLFASFGPIVFILALAMGLIAIWQGTRHKKEVKLVLGMWVIIASYMAWTAGRFVFNASPAMAVMGAWGIVGLWQYSGASSMVKEWRRQG